MFYHNIDPVLVTLGPISIRYYGLIFVAGIFLTFLIVKNLAKKNHLSLSSKDFDDLLVYGTIGVVAGARFGSIISSPNFYLSNPVQIFAIWQGGLAFHGGLLGLIVSGYIFSRRKKIAFYDIADLVAIPAGIALALGRIANYINGEFYGTPTSLPWAVKFQGVEGFRHPVQIYESLKNFFIFLVLWNLKNKELPKGTLFWAFITMYSALRFALEFLKDLPPFIWNLTWGQLWSLPLFFVGIFMLIKLLKK